MCQSDTVADHSVDPGHTHPAAGETVQTTVNQRDSEQSDTHVVLSASSFYGKRSYVGLPKRQSKKPKRYD